MMKYALYYKVNAKLSKNSNKFNDEDFDNPFYEKVKKNLEKRI